MFTLLALCWELEKELLLLGWSLRIEIIEEIADLFNLFNLFKFQPHWTHWTKIALVCRFTMSPPSGSVLDMFGVGLHKWSPCPRNYSS